MLCKELMKVEPVRVVPNDTVQTAAQFMRDENVGFLPVCDASGKAIGTLTDRDITIRLVAEGLPLTTPVSDLMTGEVVVCQPDDDIRHAQERMRRAQKSRIMCIDAQGRLLGVISLSDIARVENAEEAVHTMRSIAIREAVVVTPGPEQAGAEADETSRRIFQQIERSGVLPAELSASEAASAVLCLLSLRLGGKEARSMAGNLPLTLRRIVRQGMTRRTERPDIFGREEFIQRLAEELQMTTESAEAVSRAVFSAVQAEFPMAETASIAAQLPRDLKDFWAGQRRAA